MNHIQEELSKWIDQDTEGATPFRMDHDYVDRTITVMYRMPEPEPEPVEVEL